MLTDLKTLDVRGKLSFDESMTSYNTWGVGGRAQCVFRPADVDDLQSFLKQYNAEQPVYWMGLGSNILIPDEGLSGVVVISHPGLQGISYKDDGSVYVEAGVACSKLARGSVKHDLQGLEFMAGIPGTVGGALAMNAGAFGGSTWEHVRSLKMITRSGELEQRQVDEFKVSYRTVETAADEWFVAAEFKLSRIEVNEEAVSIRELLAKRNHSQPIGEKNCGSVFKNPPGLFAAEMIQQCGLKGLKVGGAEISPKHANFIINTGSASATDITELMAKIISTVKKQYGVELQPEVRTLGDVK
ncbi:MAG: UDP-N-acetylmuramate dehydrogenase [Gammaproteobacteria bacterium]|nr:UDP-N-acetylmuramate dehydrogenase [Gammaproteobacteria bacterium]